LREPRRNRADFACRYDIGHYFAQHYAGLLDYFAKQHDAGHDKQSGKHNESWKHKQSQLDYAPERNDSAAAVAIRRRHENTPACLRNLFPGRRESLFLRNHPPLESEMKRLPKAPDQLPLASKRGKAPSLQSLRQEAAHCRNCDLWRTATQPVFGVGSPKAKVMLVGEQPGDMEDRKGLPFVGPAGRILDEALVLAGIDRSEVYVTNAVKHFKWTPAERGKRRIHKKPRQSEIQACRPWLDAELAAIRPDVLVCLGATAAQAILGAKFRVTQSRGKWIESPLASRVLATVHPSSILRAQDDESRNTQMQAFVADLRVVAESLKENKKAA
jgi:DNA polymerase